MLSSSDHEHDTRVTANASNNSKSKTELDSHQLDEGGKEKETKAPRKLNYSDVLKQKSNQKNEPNVNTGDRTYEEANSDSVASHLVTCQEDIDHEFDYDYINDMSAEKYYASSSSTGSSNFGVLNWEHVNKLDTLLRKDVQIHSSSRCNLPTITVRLKDFIRNLHRRLIEQRVRVRDVRINGGVASYVLAREDDYAFSDIDIIFSCDLLHLEPSNIPANSSNNETTTTTPPTNSEALFSTCCDIIKQSVFDCLLDYYPSTEKPSHQHLREAYVNKMAKIYQPVNQSSEQQSSLTNDGSAAESAQSLQSSSRWSLISLYNDHGQNIELKFVDKMKRQFQFSVDAFQIHLDSLLQFYDCKDSQHIAQSQTQNLESYTNDDTESISSYCSTSTSSSDSSPCSSLSQYQASQISSPILPDRMNENCYPTVYAESMYGDFEEAMYHLNEKLIATKSPEEIRGGGLLKYCNLIVRGYTPAYDMAQMHTVEKYMCSRFFIDFKDLVEQESQLNAYLNSHFYNEPHLCVSYLRKLYEVVNSSTVCLMGHERKLTLNLIENFAQRYTQYDQEQQFHESNNQLNECDMQQQSNFQQVIYVDELNNDGENYNNEECGSNSSSSSSCCSVVHNENSGEYSVEPVNEQQQQQRVSFNANGQSYSRSTMSVGPNGQFYLHQQQQPQYNNNFNHLNNNPYIISPVSQANTHFLNASNSISHSGSNKNLNKASQRPEASQVVVNRKKSASSSFSSSSLKNMTNSFNYQQNFQPNVHFASQQFQNNQHKNKYPNMSSTSSSSSSTSPSPTPSVYSYGSHLANVMNPSTSTLTQAKSSSASELNFMAKSYSSSLSSSVASSMVSSPSPSPSPNFYITTASNDDEENDDSEETTVCPADNETSRRNANSTSNETLVLESNDNKENDDVKVSNSSQRSSSADSKQSSPSTPSHSIFSCKILASSPRIEVYDYYCPPVVSMNASVVPSPVSTPTVHFFKPMLPNSIQIFQQAPSVSAQMLAKQYNGSALPVTFAFQQAYSFVSNRPNQLTIPANKTPDHFSSKTRPAELVN